MEKRKASIRNRFVQPGLPQFDAGPDGYPLPGKVIKYYRQQMKYIDGDGREKHWTQADLARQLRLTTLMVKLMENKNQGLDSIERRRALASLLKIPPVLLGLASLEQLNEALAVGGEALLIPSGTSRDIKTINLYKEALFVYNEKQMRTSSQASIRDIEHWISQIRDDALKTHQNKELLYIIWEFHRLAAKIYSDDICNWNMAHKHLSEGLKISGELGDVNLQLIDLNQLCAVHILQQNAPLAKIVIDAAIAQSKNASQVVRSLVYANAARAYALDMRDLSDTMSVGKFLEYSQRLMNEIAVQDERYIPIRVDALNCLFKQSDGYRMLGKVSSALEILDEIGENNPDSVRRTGLLNLYRSECYIELKRPEYEGAFMLLLDAFDVYKDTDSIYNIERIKRAYKTIEISPYGNSPDVVHLGMKLRHF